MNIVISDTKRNKTIKIKNVNYCFQHTDIVSFTKTTNRIRWYDLKPQYTLIYCETEKL